MTNEDKIRIYSEIQERLDEIGEFYLDKRFNSPRVDFRKTEICGDSIKIEYEISCGGGFTYGIEFAYLPLDLLFDENWKDRILEHIKQEKSK